MKKLICFLLFLCALSAFAQKQNLIKCDPAEKQALIEKIISASQKIQTLKCDFTQEKQLTFLQNVDKSTGTMHFQNPSNLRWEYLSPEKYHFIFSQDKISFTNSSGATSYNSASNRPFKMLSELIISFISGKGLKENSNFDMEYYTDSKQIVVKMIPQSKEMKKMLKEVVLYLDMKTYLAQEIHIFENSEDITRFIFSKIETNIPFDKQLFHPNQN